MSESKDYIDMAFKSIQGFSNGGKLDAKELGEILEIAEKDGEIDENEIRVLRSIISKIKPEEVDEAMRSKLKEISDKINA